MLLLGPNRGGTYVYGVCGSMYVCTRVRENLSRGARMSCARCGRHACTVMAAVLLHAPAVTWRGLATNLGASCVSAALVL